MLNEFCLFDELASSDKMQNMVRMEKTYRYYDVLDGRWINRGNINIMYPYTYKIR